MTSTLLHKSRHTTPVLETLKIRTKHNKLRETVQRLLCKTIKQSLIVMGNSKLRIRDDLSVKRFYCSRELASQGAALDKRWTT